MTFTEAAVEVLRRAGKPLHFAEIAGHAVQENLLSHVGQDPEVTMGQRLAAMAKREEDRKVVAVAPEGTFALIEWNVPAEAIIEPVSPPLQPPEPEGLYRPREREPRAIHAQARRRLQELQAEHEPGSVLTQEVEKERVEKEEREKQRRSQKGQRRYPPPAEVVFEWLAQRQSGAPMKELADGLLEKGLLSEALVRDAPSLVTALLEDNRRRTEAGRKPAFIIDGERVTLVEFPPPPVAGMAVEYDRAPQTGLGRPPTSSQLVAETRRAAARALRRRIAELETSAFEGVCAVLLEKMGMRDVRVAKRGKEGPLYLARQRRGLSDLRVAVRLVRGLREIGRGDVQELRKDLAHYSAQMALVLAPGEASREARAEASAAGQPPVALYVGEALADEMVALRVGVTVQVVELVDVDEGFFQATVKAAPRDDKRDEPRRRDGREPREGREGREPREQAEADNAASSSDASSGSEVGLAAESAPADAVTLEPGTAQAEAAAPAPAETTADEPARDDEKRDRGRRGGRPEPRDREPRDRDPRRAALPSDQAWGQPAGTPRPAGVPYGPVTYDPHPASAAQATSGDGTAAARDAVPPPPPEALAQPDPAQADAQPAAPAIGAAGSEGARSTEGSDTSAASSERPL